LEIARENVAKIEGLFQDFGRSSRDILFINDISLYLQAGTTEVLLNWIRSAKTVVAMATMVKGWDQACCPDVKKNRRED